jgi:hypothetical protein
MADTCRGNSGLTSAAAQVGQTAIGWIVALAMARQDARPKSGAPAVSVAADSAVRILLG